MSEHNISLPRAIVNIPSITLLDFLPGYVIIIPLPPPILARKEVIAIATIIINLVVDVMAGMVCHYICKWLDDHKK